MNCHDCLFVIDEYHDGEMDAHSAHVVAKHLRECAQCQAAYAALQFEQTEVYANYERPVKVTPALWSAVQKRLAAEQVIVHHNFFTRFKTLCVRNLFALNQQPQFVGATVVVAMLVIVAAFFGYRQTPRLTSETNELFDYQVVATPEKSDESPIAFENRAADDSYNTFNQVDSAVVDSVVTAPTSRLSERDRDRRLRSATRSTAFVKATSAMQRQKSFDVAAAVQRSEPPVRQLSSEVLREVEFGAAEHIERAELLLRFFRNIDLSVRDSIGEVARERRQSKRLLFDNILLRRSAAINGNEPVAEVLSSVEPLLIDIANLPDRPSAFEIDSIKNRIQRKEMVATLQAHHTLVAAETTSSGY